MSRKLTGAFIAALVYAGMLGATVADASTATLFKPMADGATALNVCIAGFGAPIARNSLTVSGVQTGGATAVVTCTAGAAANVRLDMGADAAARPGPIQRKTPTGADADVVQISVEY